VLLCCVIMCGSLLVGFFLIGLFVIFDIKIPCFFRRVDISYRLQLVLFIVELILCSVG
jgi:hypothetical protein